MVRVAVAGGTGGVGSTVVNAISSLNRHDVFVLTRQPTDKSTGPGVTALVVDYSSPNAVAQVLETNHIDTVISCLSLNSKAGSDAQLDLIRAADKAPTVKRFVPSEFGTDHLDPSKRAFPSADLKTAAVKLLKTTDLEYTRFIIGNFMDYHGPARAPTRMRVIAVALDHAARKAVVPGDGNMPVSLTHSTDLARYVAASLDLEKWEETTVVVGDRVTMNEMIQLAEEAAGEKFEITRVPLEDIKTTGLPDLPCNQPKYQFISQEMVAGIRKGAGIGIATGMLDVEVERLKLDEEFPGLKPMSVAEFFRRYNQ